MADITAAVNKFKTAANGEDVRDGFVEAISLVNTDAIAIANKQQEIDTRADDAAESAQEAAATATTKATAAAASATSAASSASAAAASANSIGTKAADAAASATAAAASASAAAESATTAGTKATDAATSAGTASTKAAAAAESATNAAASAETASEKATDAGTSAEAAATSATAAAGSATSAAASADTANTKATEAAASASSIGTKATEAAASATAAAGSASAAEAAAVTAASYQNTVSTEEKATWNGKQAALGFTPENVANKGKTNGYAALDETGKVPAAQLPTLGAGDMSKATYDTNDSGVVDNAEKVNGHTVGMDVPADAKFTDTVYTHPLFTAAENGLYKITVNAEGHVTSATAVTKADITALGIPGSDMTAAAILTALKTVDGSGSALDADQLDGKEATDFAPTSHGTHVTYGTATTALTSGGTGAIGSAETLARSDHTHSLPTYPDLDGHAGNTNIHVTADKQTEWNKNTTDIAALYSQTGSLTANDAAARQEILDMKIKLDELNVAEFLNKTGIGFFDLFEDTSQVDTTNTTATIASTDATFTGAKVLQFNKQTFGGFTDVELAIYDLSRELFTVDVAVNNSATIAMNITPGSRTVGEKFYYNGSVYTITAVTAS